MFCLLDFLRLYNIRYKLGFLFLLLVFFDFLISNKEKRRNNNMARDHMTATLVGGGGCTVAEFVEFLWIMLNSGGFWWIPVDFQMARDHMETLKIAVDNKKTHTQNTKIYF